MKFSASVHLDQVSIFFLIHFKIRWSVFCIIKLGSKLELLACKRIDRWSQNHSTRFGTSILGTFSQARGLKLCMWCYFFNVIPCLKFGEMYSYVGYICLPEIGYKKYVQQLCSLFVIFETLPFHGNQFWMLEFM